MLKEIISQAKNNSQTTGNRIDFELDKLTKKMTNQEIREYAIEQVWDRLEKLTKNTMPVITEKRTAKKRI